jgi:hypothetical protein
MSILNLVERLFNNPDVMNKLKSVPEQYNNLNLTSGNSTVPRYTAQVTNPGTMNASNVPVMNAKEVKTMSHGGSVEIGKGKDYIKDLL